MHKEAWQRVYVGIRHMHREHFILLAVGSRVQTPAIATHLRDRSREIGLTT